MEIKTYRQLLLLLQNIPEDNLDDNLTLLDDGEYFPIELELLYSDDSNDVLDQGHPYLTQIFK